MSVISIWHLADDLRQRSKESDYVITHHSQILELAITDGAG